MTATTPNDVWVTGVGLLSAAGEGVDAHLAAFDAADAPGLHDEQAFAPYPIHPLATVDMGRQIPKKSDLRQMEPWQRIGVYAAGLALDDAAEFVAEQQFLAFRIERTADENDVCLTGGDAPERILDGRQQDRVRIRGERARAADHHQS